MTCGGGPLTPSLVYMGYLRKNGSFKQDAVNK